ncbi:hypothetical protein MVEN_02543900 [Mycena venus]|uniref:CHAT domain-containing protein n=1 Tax=Mycena venus TaxID=2733690 RepID=A0A8H6U2R1_9AGAR|nr:hypothetical protein MVEN_02543900 [Mycena venus]
MSAELIISGNIFLETVRVASDGSANSWKLGFGCYIPFDAPTFVIAIKRHSETEGSRLVGSIEIRREKVIVGIEQSSNFQNSCQLKKVNPDGPLLQFNAGFSVSVASPSQRSDFSVIGISENNITSVKRYGIDSALAEIKSSVAKKTSSISAVSTQLSVIHERILLFSDGSEKRPLGLEILGSVWSQFKGNQRRGRWLYMLGEICDDFYSITGALDVLKRGVCVYSDAVRDSPGSARYLSRLSTLLRMRFERLSNIADLKRSISTSEAAVQLTPDGHRDKPILLDTLGIAHLRYFERFGALTNINESVAMHEAAVNLSHGNKPGPLVNLGNSLLARFHHLDDLADIDGSVSMFETALRMSSDDDPFRPIILNNFGNCLFHRYERLRDRADIDNSVRMFETAVMLTPEGHPARPARMSSLGQMLSWRFGCSRDPIDLDRSISFSEDAVRLTSDDHPNKASHLYRLGASLRTRFHGRRHTVIEVSRDGRGIPRLTKREGFTDLDNSIAVFEATMKLIPDDHPSKVLLRIDLTDALSSRFEALSGPSDSRKILAQSSLAACSTAAAVRFRFLAVKDWVTHAAKIRDPSLLQAYTVAIELLPELAWLGLSIEDRHYRIMQAGPLVRDAAAYAIACEMPEKAVEWLEQGRSIIWSQVFNLRSPVDALKQAHPDLADKLVSLSTQLEAAGTRSNSLKDGGAESYSSRQAVAQKCHENAQERADLLKKIRKLPGFERFLLPKTICELSAAAQKGPVVFLNATQSRCDALILQLNMDKTVMHVPLTDCTPSELANLTKLMTSLTRGSDRLYGRPKGDSAVPEEQFATVLSEIWVRLVKPVLDALAITNPTEHNPKHIWWCPTGPLTFLPIHAAGRYGASHDFGSKLSDFVISSYTPSLTALIESFRPQSGLQTELKLLAVAQPFSLPGTQKEIDSIELWAKGKVPLTRLEGQAATVRNVQMEMMDSTWVHFACHGIQDITSPTDSALLLAGDERLTLSNIIHMSLPNARLAFLSACQTATGDKELQEESIHLAAGMLLAGYRGVIGSMWSISDSDAPEVARDVYEYLLRTSPPDPARAAEALQLAVRRLREKPGGTKTFFHWVPFIHVGI